MTANYSTQTYTIPENNHFIVSRQHSPASSISPQSPRMQDYLQQHAPNPYKQLRPLKSPLYVPAALRPTEHFYTPSPMTPPKSLHGSLDNLENAEPQVASPEHQYPLDLESYDPDWVQEEELGEVTGPPTKEHWKVCHIHNYISTYGLDCRPYNDRGDICETRFLANTSLSSPTKLLRPATRQNAGRHSTYSFANTTAGTVATSFAPHIRLSRSLSTNMPSFTQTASLREHAKPVIASFSAGTLRAPSAARTARTARMRTSTTRACRLRH